MIKLATALVTLIDRLNNAVGKITALFALAIVLLQFIIVLMRYVFGIGSIFIQESIIYFHAILFMVGAGYTLLHDGHVRLDVFYRTASKRTKNLINLMGSLVCLLPMSLLIWAYAWPYVLQSWRVLEGSKETSGIQAVFLLKTVVLVFAGLLFAQGVSLAVRSLFGLIGRPLPPFTSHSPAAKL
jgi:TRAP-type mannitol/chloroaromatic compound transport system permease small subunit